MNHPAARFPRLAFAIAILILLPVSARSSDYGRIVGGDFDDMVWTRDTPFDDDYATNVGPPGSGDNASMSGDGAVTATGGSVDKLGSTVDFIVNGAFSANSYVSTATLQGSGILTVQSVPVGVTVEGGNLVVADCPGSIVVNGGSLTSPNYHAPSLNLDLGGVATLTSVTTDLNASVAGGSRLTVPGIHNSRDITLTVKDTSSTVTVADGISVTAGFLNISGGGTLTANGTIVLDGGDDVDGNHIGGGGDCTDAGSFLSANALVVGNVAPQPGFGFGLLGGAVASCNVGKIGQQAGSYGIVTLSGAGTIWSCGQGLAVGDQGEGDLKMDTGAHLQLGDNSVFAVGLLAGGTGTLTADGTGTTIDARKALVSIGMEANAQGSVLLTGGASLMLDMNTFIGDSGSGSLTFGGGSQGSIGLDTGAVPTKFGVGNQAGSNGSVSVEDAGSQFVTSDAVAMAIGFYGTGFFGAGNGGTVQTGGVGLGLLPGASGTVVVDGSGTAWTARRSVSVGGIASAQPAGKGMITLSNGAQMRAAATPGFRCFISSTGQIVLDATSAYAVGGGAFGPGGTMRVSTGGTLNGKGRQVGTTVYNTNVTGKVIIGAGGKFQPGGDPDVFSIQGDCDLNDAGAGGGETDFEIGGAGTAGTDYDQLVVSGTATLGGTLRLVYLPGYTPKVGDAFVFVKAPTVAGGFAQVVAPGLTVNPVPGPGGLTVTVTAVTPMSPPAVTSVLTATAATGAPFSYQIAATNTPGGYAATGLPDGLALDPGTGLVTGAPTTAGTYNVALSATNTGGTGTATLVLTVGNAAPPTPGAPVITSATSAAGTVGAAFGYQIAASNAPTGFAASGLPGGLNVDPASGLITGTPTAAGVFTVTLSATNASGTGTATLNLTITSPSNTLPVVTVAASGGTVRAGAKAKLIFRRAGDTGAALAVRYKVMGSAQKGVDYKPLPGVAMIPAGATQAVVKFKTVGGHAGEGTRVAKVKLLPATDGSYTPGSPAVVKLKIIDGD